MPIYRKTWREEVQENWNKKQEELAKFTEESLKILEDFDKIVKERIEEIKKQEVD